MIQQNTKTRVCHITSAHPRYDGRIFLKECRSLASHGYEVILLVNDELKDEERDGVQIISVGHKFRGRMERLLSSSQIMKNKAEEIDADIYHLHDPELLSLAKYLRRKDKKVIYDAHEDVPQLIRFKDYIPLLFRGLISKIYGLVEKRAIKELNAVITVTPQIVKRMAKINKNTIMITNYPILDEKKTSRLNPNQSDKYFICFAGGISKQWSHENIIKAIEPLDNVEYIIAGKCNNQYLSDLERLPAWRKVHYIGIIPNDQVPEIFNKSFAGMAILSHNNQIGKEGTLGNTKLFEYMAAGLPVIAANNRIWTEIISEENCGILVDPDDVETIGKAIKLLFSDVELAQIMGENGMKAAESKYNWRTQEKNLLNLYDSLIEGLTDV